MVKIIKYLVLSDIHLGHNTNKVQEIIENLRKYLVENHKIFKQLDIVFLAGDIFDKLLSNHSKEYIMAIEWLTELILYCGGNNIKLRILEGTPSHDWKQSKLINTVLNKLNINVDFKYIDTLYIETMTDLNLSILYVPDEYKHDASETYLEVLNLLKENNLSKVDIAIMHGQFNYQLPMIKLKSSHDEDLYLDIVKYYISIGHIHTPSVFDRIIAQGSFDRLAHGEEEDKGGILITLNKNRPEFMFIKNKHAKVYKTFTYKTSDVEYIIKALSKEITKLPIGSQIRCIVANDVFMNKSIKSLHNMFLGYSIKVEKNNKSEVSNTELLEQDTVEESFNITSDNVKELLFKELDKHNLDSKLLKVAEAEFDMLFLTLV
jgi:DNA repair exonuclease SbcCD nuclease subunit